MLKTFIKIRFLQFYRDLAGIGLFRILFMLIMVAFLGLMLFQGTGMFPHVYVALLIYLALIFLIQVKRKDKFFLKSHFNNYRLIYFVEYLILTIPILVCLIYHSQWLAIPILFLTLVLIVQFDPHYKLLTLNTIFQRWVPSDSFEWKSGMRNAQIYLIPIWIIAMGTSFYPGSIPVAILILGIIPLSFFDYGEPLPMLLAPELNARNFLIKKVKVQFIQFSALTFPLIIAFLLFHIEYWYIPLAEYFLLFSLQTNAILIKYAFYEPNIKSSAANTYRSIGTLGLVLLFFLPIIWIMSFWFYLKSIENLNLYLHDFD